MREEQWTTKDSGKREQFAGGGQRDTEEGKLDWTLGYDGPMFRRYVELMTRGAVKYEARNWMKFDSEVELERAKRSLARHYHQYVSGEVDEDHAAAIIFNLNVIEYLKERLEAEATEDRFEPVETEKSVAFAVRELDYWPMGAQVVEGETDECLSPGCIVHGKLNQ